MALLGTIGVKLKAQTATFERDMKRVTTGLEKNRATLAAVGLAAGAMSAALVLAGRKAIGTFAKFEKGMARVGAITGETGASFNKLSGFARKMAKTTEFSATQVADGMGFMAQAGFEVDLIYSALPSVLELSSAGMIDVGRAADITTNIVTGMGLATEDLASANDVLIAAMTGANTDLNQLGEAFKFVGPVAKAAGVSFEEATTAISLMSNAGIQGSLAGTALRGMMTRLLNPSTEAAVRLRELGVNAVTSSGQMKPLREIIAQLGASSATAGDLMAIFGQRAGPGVAALIDQGVEAFDKFTLRLKESAGIAGGIARRQLATFAGQVKILQSNVEEAEISLGQALVPALTLMNRIVLTVVDAFNNLSKETKSWIANVGLGLAVLSGLVAALSSILIAIPFIVSGFAAIGITSIAAFGPILLVIAAVAAGIGGIILIIGAMRQAWEGDLFGMKTFALDAWDAIKRAWDVVVDGILGAVDSLKASFKDLAESFTFLIDASKGGVTAPVAPAPEEDVGTVGVAPEQSANETILGGLIKNITGTFGEGIDFITDMLKKAGFELKGFGSKVKNAAKDVNKAIDAATESLIGLGDMFILPANALADAMSKARGPIEREGDVMVAAWRRAGEASITVDRTMKKIADGGMSTQQEMTRLNAAMLRGAKQSIENLKALKDVVLNAMGEVGKIIASTVEGFSKGGIFGAIVAVIGEILSRLESFKRFGEMFDKSLFNALERLNPLIESLSPLIEAFILMHDLLTELVFTVLPIQEAFAALGKVFGAITDAIRFVIEKIVGAVADLLESLGFKGKARRLRKFIDPDLLPTESEALANLAQAAASQREEVPAALNELTDAVRPLPDLFSDLAKSAESLNAELTNVPAGFKVALARFRAADPENIATLQRIDRPQQRGQMADVRIGTVNISGVNDPQTLWDGLKKVIEQDNFNRTGTPNSAGGTFSVPQPG